jgi:hypothetical protein
MRSFAWIVLALAILLPVAFGCGNGPDYASEEEALQGMEDTTDFEDAAATEEE